MSKYINNNKYFIGIDLHKDSVFWTIKDEAGKIVRQRNFGINERKKMKEEILSLGGEKYAVLEPVCSWMKYRKFLEGQEVETKVINPLKAKAISYNSLKNDKVDSEMLSELLRLGFVPEIIPKNKEKEEICQLLNLRSFLVKKRIKLKQKMREILIRENKRIKRCDIFGKKARKELLSLKLRSNDRFLIQIILPIAETLNSQIKEIDNLLNERYANYRNIRILQSIPGVGLLSALVIDSIIGEWKRFKKPSQLSSYAGLVPVSKDSGTKIKRGKITKKGAKQLRAILYQSALTASKHSYFSDFYQRIKEKKGHKLALVALSRKLLVLCWYLVNRQTYFNPSYANKPDLVFRLAPRGRAID